MVHCDIAPDNIIIVTDRTANGTEFRPILIDWGLATLIGDPHHGYRGRVHYQHIDVIENDRHCGCADL